MSPQAYGAAHTYLKTQVESSTPLERVARSVSPSARQSRSAWSWPEEVSWRSPAPSVPTRKTSYQPGSSETKATLVPSGDRAGPRAWAPGLPANIEHEPVAWS